MKHVEAINLETRLTKCLVIVKGLIKEMDVVEFNPNLTKDQKLEELQKIRDELNKVTLEIDNVKKEIKLLSTRHLN